jgi:penicillin-binding protein 1A
MQVALKPLPVVAFTIPEGVTFVKVDPATGLLEDEQDGQASTVELFTKGSEPTQATQRRVDPIDFYKLDQIPEGAL